MPLYHSLQLKDRLCHAPQRLLRIVIKMVNVAKLSRYQTKCSLLLLYRCNWCTYRHVSIKKQQHLTSTQLKWSRNVLSFCYTSCRSISLYITRFSVYVFDVSSIWMFYFTVAFFVFIVLKTNLNILYSWFVVFCCLSFSLIVLNLCSLNCYSVCCCCCYWYFAFTTYRLYIVVSPAHLSISYHSRIAKLRRE